MKLYENSSSENRHLLLFAEEVSAGFPFMQSARRFEIALSLLFFTETKTYHNKDIVVGIYNVSAKKRRRLRNNQAANQKTKTKTQ